MTDKEAYDFLLAWEKHHEENPIDWDKVDRKREARFLYLAKKESLKKEYEEAIRVIEEEEG